jgi:putative flippase GtrA
VLLALLITKIQFGTYGFSFVTLEDAGRVSIEASVHAFFLGGRWTFQRRSTTSSTTEE